MILAAILFLCKLEGQDVKIIFGIHHFWIQHTQIDLKSHRYRFSPHFAPHVTIQASFSEIDLVYLCVFQSSSIFKPSQYFFL